MLQGRRQSLALPVVCAQHSPRSVITRFSLPLTHLDTLRKAISQQSPSRTHHNACSNSTHESQGCFSFIHILIIYSAYLAFFQRNRSQRHRNRRLLSFKSLDFLFLRKQLFILYPHLPPKMKSSPVAHRISAVQLPLSERDPKTQWSFSDTGAPRNMECRPEVRERASRTLGPEALFDQLQSNSPESNIFHWCLRRIRHSGEVKLLPVYRARAPPSHLFATGSPSTGVFLLRLNGCTSGGDHAALLRSPSSVTLRRVLWSY